MEKITFAWCMVVLTVLYGMLFITIARGNAYCEYTGEVIAVEKNAWMFDHTTITMKTYSESSITFSVIGFHDLEVGATYKIETKGDNWWYLYSRLLSAEIQSSTGSAKIE